MKVVRRTELSDGFLLDLDDGAEIKVSEELYFTKYLYEKEEFSKEEIEELIFLDDVLEANILCKKKLANGLKPRYRLFVHLKDKGYTEKVIETTLDSLEKEKYINDLKLSIKKLKRKMITSPLATKALVFWLQEQGIGEKTAIKAVEQMKIDDKDTAKKLIKKKFGQNGELIKIVKYLASKGFEKDIIAEVTNSEELWNI